MKVGIDISSVVYGTGVSNYTRELIDNLKPLMNSDLITFGFSLRRRSLLEGVSLPIPPTAMHYLWNKLHIVDVETFTGSIDIYHSSDWTQGPSKAKKVTTVHDLSPFLYPTEVDAKIVEVHTAKMRWSIKECDKFICVSQNTANDLQRLFAISQSKIAVVYEALERHFLLKPQVIKHANYVLAIGARQPRKNIERLKQACELAQKKLIIVGEGSELGYISDQDLVNYLASASVFVYPSLYEGFGLPILAAFYHNVPVVASNTSSLPEVVGEAAILVDPYSVEDIANGITTALKNRDQLIALGQKQLTKFSWEKTAEQTLKVYESLC